MSDLTYYQGNQNLRGEGCIVDYTSFQIREIQNCFDPIYFCRNYVKIINLDVGLTNFDLYDFQENMIENIVNENRLLIKTPRQAGKCVEKHTKLELNDNANDYEYTSTIEDLYQKYK